MEKMKCSVPLSMYCVYVVVNIARVFLGQFTRYLESSVSLSERAVRILGVGIQNASRAMRETAGGDGEMATHLEGQSTADVVKVFASLIEAVKSTSNVSETDDCYVDVGDVKNLSHLQSIMPDIPRYFDRVRADGTENEKQLIDGSLLQTLWYVTFVVQLGIDETSGDKRPKPAEEILRRIAASESKTTATGNWQEDYYCSLVMGGDAQRAIDIAKLDKDSDTGQRLMDAYYKCGGWKRAVDLEQYKKKLVEEFGGGVQFDSPSVEEIATRNFNS